MALRLHNCCTGLCTDVCPMRQGCVSGSSWDRNRILVPDKSCHKFPPLHSATRQETGGNWEWVQMKMLTILSNIRFPLPSIRRHPALFGTGLAYPIAQTLDPGGTTTTTRDSDVDVVNYRNDWKKIAEVIFHPEYDRKTLYNDLALIRLQTDNR